MKAHRCIRWYGFIILIAFGLSIHSTGVLAKQDLAAHERLPLSLAEKAVHAALSKCEEGGYRVSVAAVDSGGNLKVLLRGDGAGPHTQDSSFKKAYTAASIRRSTNELAALVAKVPTLQAL
ncbi:MAG: GlcG/HbpS family heme-binding protein, partial [Nitrospirales bacterium]